MSAGELQRMTSIFEERLRNLDRQNRRMIKILPTVFFAGIMLGVFFGYLLFKR